MKYTVIRKYTEFDSMVPHTEEEYIGTFPTQEEAQAVADKISKTANTVGVDIEED